MHKYSIILIFFILFKFSFFTQTKIDTSFFAPFWKDTISLHLSQKEKSDVLKELASGTWMFFKYIAYYPSDKYFYKPKQYFKVLYKPAIYYSEFIKCKTLHFKNKKKHINKKFNLISKGYPTQIKETFINNLLYYKYLYVLFDEKDSIIYIYNKKQKNLQDK